MGFDASKLVVGNFYPVRNGDKAEFVRRLNGRQEGNHGLVFVRICKLTGDEDVCEVGFTGVFDVNQGETALDIISDEPIKEPVKVPLLHCFAAVFTDGSLILQRTKHEAEECCKDHRAIGIAELPATLLVTPK